MSRSNHPGLGDLEQNGSSSLLQTLETSLDDLRTIITCRICIRPLYEPYTIACGHSFCYSCLRQWFDRDPRNKTCPDCRSEVTREPAPSYLVSLVISLRCSLANPPLRQLRDITQIFVSRAELVPAGETTEEHRAQQQEEAGRLDEDRAVGATNGKGLFGIRFRDSGPRRIPIIRDEEDGVDRCPRCTWEMEDGWCESCGYGAIDGGSESGMSDSERSYYIGEDLGDDFTEHPRMGDDMSLYGAVALPDGRHVPFNRATSVDSDGNTINEDLDAHAYQALARARRRARHPPATMLHGLGHWHNHDLHGSSSEGDHDLDDEGFPDAEQYSSDGSVGSLDNFIADDQSGGPPVERSPRNSQYGSDDGTEAAMDSDPDYAEGESGPHEPHLDEFMRREDSTPGIRDSDDDSDESPVARRRRIEAPTIDSDEDAAILAMHASRLQPPRNGTRSNRLFAPNTFNRSRSNSTARFQHDYSPDYRLLSGGGRSQQAPIEIESDSDVPVPAPRSRRKRHVVDPETSDDDSAAERSNHSTTSGTVRRESPTASVTGVSTGRGMQRRRRPSSHIVRISSPRGSPTVEGSDRTDWSPPHGRFYQAGENCGDAATQSDESSSSFMDAPQPPQTAIGRRNHNTRRLPLPSRHNRMGAPRRTHGRLGLGQSLGSRVASLASAHPPGRAPNSEAAIRFYGSDEARAAAKAERKRLKRERRHRNRESDGMALGR